MLDWTKGRWSEGSPDFGVGQGQAGVVPGTALVPLYLTADAAISSVSHPLRGAVPRAQAAVVGTQPPRDRSKRLTGAG